LTWYKNGEHTSQREIIAYCIILNNSFDLENTPIITLVKTEIKLAIGHLLKTSKIHIK